LLLCATHAAICGASCRRGPGSGTSTARAELSLDRATAPKVDRAVRFSGRCRHALASGNTAAADKPAAASGLFPAATPELQRGHARRRVGGATLALAVRAGPPVATHPVQFLAKEDFKAHEARVCFSQGYVLGDQRRPKLFTPEQYFKTQDEMAALFADLPQALENAVEIARRCSLEIELGKSRLPAFPTPKGVTLDQYLRQQAEAGLAGRLERLYPEPAARRNEAPRHKARLELEIGTITQMGFAGYFLIVADFISWARSNGACRSAPGAARAQARWWPIRCASPTSIRSSTTCCSSAFSTRSVSRCRTSTSTSARTGATR
jgi:DNA polymerase-3 subunit alpha